MSTKLPAQVQRAAGISNGMRTATVYAVSGSAVTLSVSGGLITSGVGVLSTYLPAVGDTVAVFRQDASWLILGAIGTSLGPQPKPSVTGLTPFVVSSAASLVIATVPLGVTFAAPPIITTNINASSTPKWISRAYNATTTTFNIWLYTGDGTLSSISGNVEWVATARS